MLAISTKKIVLGATLLRGLRFGAKEEAAYDRIVEILRSWGYDVERSPEPCDIICGDDAVIYDAIIQVWMTY